MRALGLHLVANQRSRQPQPTDTPPPGPIWDGTHTVSGQGDPLFWWLRPEVVRAQVIGSLSNLAVLLEAVRLASTYVRRETSEKRAVA